MASPKPSADHIVDAGSRLYHERIRANVERMHAGKFLALDIDSGEYEIADSLLSASRRLRARLPDAAVFGVRIGYDTAIRVGGHARVKSP